MSFWAVRLNIENKSHKSYDFIANSWWYDGPLILALTLPSLFLSQHCCGQTLSKTRVKLMKCFPRKKLHWMVKRRGREIHEKSRKFALLESNRIELWRKTRMKFHYPALCIVQIFDIPFVWVYHRHINRTSETARWTVVHIHKQGVSNENFVIQLYQDWMKKQLKSYSICFLKIKKEVAKNCSSLHWATPRHARSAHCCWLADDLHHSVGSLPLSVSSYFIEGLNKFARKLLLW